MARPLAQVDFGTSLQGMWDSVIAIVPKIIVFVVILVVGWIIAKIIQKVIAVVANRVKFNEFAERGVVGEALQRSNYSAGGLLAKVFFYAVLLITLQMAFNVFGPNPVSDLLSGVVAWLPKAAVAILLVLVASAIAKAVKDLLGAALGSLSYGNLLANVASIFVIALGVIAALNQVGIALTVTMPVLIAVLATVGAVIAIGVGGGMVRPMQQRWERWLARAEQETEAVGGAYERGREDAMRGAEVPTEGAGQAPRHQAEPGAEQRGSTQAGNVP